MKALKVLSIVFGSITSITLLGVILRDVSLAQEILEIESNSGYGLLMLQISDLPSVGLLYFALSVALVLTIGCIAGIVLLYKNSAKLKLVVYILIALILSSVFLHPYFRMGFGAASPREVAVFHAVSAVLTVFFLFIASRKIVLHNKG